MRKNLPWLLDQTRQAVVGFFTMTFVVLPSLLRNKNQFENNSGDETGLIKYDSAASSMLLLAAAQTTVEYPHFPISAIPVLGNASIISGNDVYIAGGDYCVSRYDFSNPIAPVFSAGYANGKKCFSLVMNSARTLIFATDGGVHILDANTLVKQSAIPNINLKDIALNYDDTILYGARDNSAGKGPELVPIDVRDSQNPVPNAIVSVSRSQFDGYYSTASKAKLILRSQDDTMAFAFSYWSMGGYSREASIALFNTNSSGVFPKGFRTWNIGLTVNCGAGCGHTGVISNIAFSADKKELLMTAEAQFVLSGYALTSIAQPFPGTYKLNITNITQPPTVIRSDSINNIAEGVNDAVALDENTVVSATKANKLKVINFKQFIPTDPANVVAARQSGAVSALSYDKNRGFLYALTESGELKTYAPRASVDVPATGYAIVPIMAQDGNNNGKLFFFANNVTDTNNPFLMQPVIQSMTTTENSVVFSFNATSGLFNATSPNNQTVTAIVRVNNVDYSVDFPLIQTHQLTDAPTTPKPTTQEPTTQQPTVAPQTTTPPPATPQPITTLPPAQTFPPNIDTLAPGVTAAPDAIKIITASSGKMQIESTADESTVIIFMRPGVDTPMRASFPNVNFFFDNSKGELRLIGKPSDINAALASGRISSTDNNGDSPIELTVGAADKTLYQDYDVTTIQKITLGQFGANHAPEIIFNNTTNITQVNATLGSSFSFSLKSLFTDIDHDPLNYYLVDAPDWMTLRNGVMSGTPASEGEFDITVASSDGAKNSKTLHFKLMSQYQKPTIDITKIQTNLSAKAGTQKTIKPIPRSAVSGTGVLKCTASLENGDPLPDGIEWDSDLWELTVRGKTLTNYALKFTVKDIYDAETSAVIPLRIIDQAPIANQTAVSDITALAEKPIEITLPSNVIVDPDGDGLTFKLNPSYSWAEFIKSDTGKLLLSLTPPKSALGQSISMILEGFDGWLSASVNITVHVPPNRAPIINEILQNKTYLTGNSKTYSVFDGFISPDNRTLEFEVVGLENDGREVKLSDFLDFDKRRAEISINNPTTDHVGKYLLRVRAKDDLNSEATQTIKFDIEFSTWDEMKYWLLRVGAPLGILGTIAGGYSFVVQYWGGVRSFFGKKYITDPDFKFDLESQTYQYEIKKRKPDDNRVKFNMTVNGVKDPGCWEKPVAVVAGFFSNYLRGRYMFEKINCPWITYDDLSLVISINPDLIPRHAKPVVVQLLTASTGRVYKEFTIDPKAYLLAQPLLSPPPKDAAHGWKEAEISGDSASLKKKKRSKPKSDSERSESSGDYIPSRELSGDSGVLVVPEAETRNPLRSPEEKKSESQSGQEKNPSPLAANSIFSENDETYPIYSFDENGKPYVISIGSRKK